MRQGGLYIVDKEGAKPKRQDKESTAEHELGNRPRDAEGKPLAPMRRDLEENVAKAAKARPAPKQKKED